MYVPLLIQTYDPSASISSILGVQVITQHDSVNL